MPNSAISSIKYCITLLIISLFNAGRSSMAAVFAGASFLLKDIFQRSIGAFLAQAEISISVFGKTCSGSDSLSNTS